MRLDLALILAYPGLSRRQARAAIEKGQVLLAGQVVRAPGVNVPGDAPLRWEKSRKALPRARLSLPVLHQDEHLLIVDKPAGLLTVPSGPGVDEDTAFRRVLEYARHLNPRRPYAGMVHRLDRDTSGALCFALSGPARAGLIALFREHRIERRYAAIVEGQPAGDQLVIDAAIADTFEGGRRRIARGPEQASPALTRVSVRERLPGAALLELQLETGRQHQIRLHLAHVGLPVLGDPVYRPRARRPPLVVPRQMLHAELLAFIHPLTGEPVRARSPWPRDFAAALAALRRARSRRPVAEAPALERGGAGPDRARLRRTSRKARA